MPDSSYCSMKRHGIRMYVLETVKLRDEATNSMIDTLVLAMNPLAMVVYIKFFLYL